MLTIRHLGLQEMVFPMEVAYKEGWNPGLYDGAAFFQADPDGFFLAEQNGGMAGAISAVRCGEDLVVIGNHFVLPPFRGKGIGKALWEHALLQAGEKTAVCNGLTEGRAFYESYGFQGAYNVIRYGGVMFAEARHSRDVYPACDIDFRRLAQADAVFFGAARERVLKAWLETPVMESVCLLKDGDMRGWGSLRRCRKGWRLGPVFARDYACAEEMIRHLAMKTCDEWVYIDIPETNVQAIRLAFAIGMAPLSARLKLFWGERIQEPIEQIFGFTSLDIG